jgi:hypothetical protein
LGACPYPGPLYSRIRVDIPLSPGNYISNGLCSIQEILDGYNERVKVNNTVSGTLSTDSITVDCNQGVGTQHSDARKGSWTGQM